MRRKTRLTAVSLLWGVCLVLGLIAMNGCEDDDGGSSALKLSPTFAMLDADMGTNVVFSVRGGRTPYVWTVNDEELGTLVSAGDTAIYTSEPAEGQNFVTVTDKRSNAVTATITQTYGGS